jgi:hypothetical protein
MTYRQQAKEKRSKYRKTEEEEKRELSGRISFLAENKKGGEKKKNSAFCFFITDARHQRTNKPTNQLILSSYNTSLFKYTITTIDIDVIFFSLIIKIILVA